MKTSAGPKQDSGESGGVRLSEGLTTGRACLKCRIDEPIFPATAFAMKRFHPGLMPPGSPGIGKWTARRG